jgi:glycosyltransferase involved in cell wall biosynthesis
MLGMDGAQIPEVSVVVAARNEEISLRSCLESLLGQTGVVFEIIVVDDHSTDRTREIAESFSDRAVRVLDAPQLPQGWSGKNNALVVGTRTAGGNWFLFTDADTIHLPGSLARALKEARDHHADMLSYSPEQIVVTFWEMATLPVVFGELARQYPPSKVRDPHSAIVAANGQYILITRESYAAVGGHAAIADQILEDVALARAVKRSGRKIFFRYAADAVRTRMYRNFAQLREGWTKNLALLFPAPRRLALMRILEFALIVAAIAAAIVSASREHWRPAFISGSVGAILCILFFARIRRAHFSWDANLLSLLGLPVFSYLLLCSQRLHHRGIVSWKGRSYASSISDAPISNKSITDKSVTRTTTTALKNNDVIPSEARNLGFTDN